MESKSVHNSTVGELVADDFRAATILRRAGIDFCCGGEKTLVEACKETGAELTEIAGQLELLALTPVEHSINYKEWDTGFLGDYIVNTHHKYVTESLPELLYYTRRISEVHGNHHPELIEVAGLLLMVNDELVQHMRMEEEVLFPALKTEKLPLSEAVRSMIMKEVTRMKGEHEFAGWAMGRIRILTENYSIPPDACNTYQVTLNLLRQFEENLHIHVHLENNILYPNALKTAQ